MSNVRTDIVGNRFGHLVVTRMVPFDPSVKYRQYYVDTLCDCGVKFRIRTNCLRDGVSCGCKRVGRSQGHVCIARSCDNPRTTGYYCSEDCRQRQERNVELARREREERKAKRGVSMPPIGCEPQPTQGDRRDDCLNYTRCLDHASTLNWPGFTCGACPGYQPGETRDAMLVKLCSSRFGDAVIHLERE